MNNDFTSSSILKREARRQRIPLRAIAYKDTMPEMTIDGGYIGNLASSGNEGTHWVAVWKEGDETFYYDPFGLPPPTELLEKMTTPKRYYSDKQIQDMDTGYCGMYVIEYLDEMNKRHTSNVNDLKRYQSYFKKDTRRNLPILKRLWKRD